MGISHCILIRLRHHKNLRFLSLSRLFVACWIKNKQTSHDHTALWENIFSWSRSIDIASEQASKQKAATLAMNEWERNHLKASHERAIQRDDSLKDSWQNKQHDSSKKSLNDAAWWIRTKTQQEEFLVK